MVIRPHVAVVVGVGVVADAVAVGVGGLGRVQWEGVVGVTHSVAVVVDVLGEGGGAAADYGVGLSVAVGVNVRARVGHEGVAVVAVAGPVRACGGVTVGVVPLRCVQRELVVRVVIAVVVGVGVQRICASGKFVHVEDGVTVVIVVEVSSCRTGGWCSRSASNRRRDAHRRVTTVCCHRIGVGASRGVWAVGPLERGVDFAGTEAHQGGPGWVN